jgi:hypothetical protein
MPVFSDLLAGWSVGLSWAILCWLVARQFCERGVKAEADMLERQGDHAGAENARDCYRTWEQTGGRESGRMLVTRDDSRDPSFMDDQALRNACHTTGRMTFDRYFAAPEPTKRG